MAQDATNEQQSMRQQGAGMRDIGNVEVDMGAGRRQERQLMRQRGAGNRQINNIDFGFAFTTPSTGRLGRSRTRSKTPTTATTLPAHATSTPGRGSIDPNQLQRDASESPTSAQTARQSSIDAQWLDQQPLRKRRRLSEVSNLIRQSSPGPRLASFANNTIEEGLHEKTANDADYSYSRPAEIANVPSSPLFFAELDPNLSAEVDKENHTSTTVTAKPASKKRKRKSIGQQSLFKKKRKSDTPKLLPPSPKAKQADFERQHLDDGNRRRSVASAEPSVEPTPAPWPQNQAFGIVRSASNSRPQAQSTPRGALAQTKKRKKRKSVVQGKKRRRSSGLTASTQSQLVENTEEDALENTIEAEEETLNELSFEHYQQPTDEDDRHNELSFEYDQQNTDEKKEPRSAHHGTPISAMSKRYLVEEPDHYPAADNDDADETYLPDPTPAATHAKSNSRHPQRSARSASSTKLKSSRKSSFPIVTHRMINVHSLPTIPETFETTSHAERPQSDQDDELSHPPATITTRSTPNAADILSQVCTETIDTAITNLKSGASALSRADLNRRTNALQAFRDTLTARLFDLSQSLDSRLTMESRLRKIRREKANLQNQWLELRHRRDQLELRKDAVRMRHWEGEVLARRKFRASQAAFGIEAAMEREEAESEGQDEADLEMRLREVGGVVSSFEGGGVVNKIKDLNRRLEALAGVLA